MQYRQDIVCYTNAHYADGVSYNINSKTIRSIWHNTEANFLHLGKLPTPNCDSCGATYRRKYMKPLVRCTEHLVL